MQHFMSAAKFLSSISCQPLPSRLIFCSESLAISQGAAWEEEQPAEQMSMAFVPELF